MSELIRAYNCTQCQTTHTEDEIIFAPHLLRQSKHGLFKVERTPLSRAAHFANLNASINHIQIGREWEINEEIFNEFLNVLPPAQFAIPGASVSFAMCEHRYGRITTAYHKTDGRYFCRWIER